MNDDPRDELVELTLDLTAVAFVARRRMRPPQRVGALDAIVESRIALGSTKADAGCQDGKVRRVLRG